MLIPEVMRKWLSTALICFAMIFSHMAHAAVPSDLVTATKASQTVTHASHQHAGEKPAVGGKHSSEPADSNCASQCPAFVSATVDLLSDRWPRASVVASMDISMSGSLVLVGKRPPKS